jgi:3-oxoacyl-[acyl-carrier protein] reductase
VTIGRLAGRTVLITGAAGPTGSTIARRLAGEGAAVALNVHRNVERAETLAREIIACGGRAIVAPADVADRSAVNAMVDAVRGELGHIDILVNNAGTMRGTNDFPNMTADDLDFVLDVDLKGAFYSAQAVTTGMIERRYGRIVSVSSIAATGSHRNANYAVAKAGLEGLTRTLALELGRYGITANCVAPGLIRSDKTAGYAPWIERQMTRHASMGRAVESIDIANAVLFFASDEARFVTGQILKVSAGLDVVVRGMQEPPEEES